MHSFNFVLQHLKSFINVLTVLLFMTVMYKPEIC